MRARKIITTLLWVFFFVLLIYWLSICSACTVINFDPSVENYGKVDFNGIDKDNPPASVNPPTHFVTRCFRKYPTGSGEYSFHQKVEKERKILIARGNEIMHTHYEYAPNDGLTWRRGDLMWVVFYLEEKEK